MDSSSARHNLSWLLTLALVHGLVACAPRVPLPRVAQPKTAAIESDDWKLLGYPALPSGATLVGRDPNGTQRIQLGGLRVELRNASVNISEQGLLEDIESCCRSGKGWMHFAVGGRVYWSDTFLGALEPIANLGWYGHTRIRQCGPEVIIDNPLGNPELWGRTGPKPMPGAQELELIRFSSALHGKAIASPDHLLESDDGGLTFHDSASKPEQFSSPSAYLGTAAHPVDNSVANETLERLLAAWVHRSVTSDAGAFVGGLRLADGTWVRDAISLHAQFISLRRPDGSVIDRKIDGPCHLLAWGTQLLAHCYEGKPTLSVIYPDNPAPVPEVPMRPRFVIADPAGRYLVVEPWPEDEFQPEKFPLIVFDGTRWHVHENLQYTPHAIDGNWLLVTGGSQSTCQIVRLSELDRPGFDFGPDTKNCSSREVQLLDGAVLYVRRTGSRYDPKSEAELVRTEIGNNGLSAGAAHPIMRDIDWIAFADARHGIASNWQAQPYRTIDGGEHWSPIEGAELGPGHQYLEARCWKGGCSIGKILAWTKRSFTPASLADLGHPPLAEPPTTPAAGKAEPQQSPGATGGGFDTNITPKEWYECHGQPIADKQALVPIVPDPASFDPKSPHAASRYLTLPAKGGIFEKRPSSGGFAWHGRDALGVYDAKTPELSGETAEIFQAFGNSFMDLPLVYPDLVSRNFALLWLLKKRDSQAIVMHSDGRILRIILQELDGLMANPLPGGGAFVEVMHEGNQRLGQRYLEGIAIDSMGEVVARRWFLVRSANIAVGSDGPGIVDGESGKVDFYSLKPGSAPTALFVPPNPQNCKQPAKADATIFFGTSPWVIVDKTESIPFIVPTHMSPSSTAVGLVEVNGDGACLRGIQIGSPFSLDLRSDTGTMRGVLIGPKATQNVTCKHRMK